MKIESTLLLCRGALAAVLALALTGCGGGGSGAAGNSDTAGALRFFVKWPEPSRATSGAGVSRVIPEAAGRIRVVVEKLQGGKLAEKLLVRPASVGQTGQIDITNVPSGNVKVTATAYPDPEGAGEGANVSQASGSVILTVRAEQRTTETLTLNSTVRYVQLVRLVGESNTLSVGDQQLFAALARDADGSLVVTGPHEWFWNTSSDSPPPARLDSDGQTAGVVALAPGEFFVRAIFIGVEPGVQEAPYADTTLTIRPASTGSGSLEIPVQ